MRSSPKLWHWKITVKKDYLMKDNLFIVGLTTVSLEMHAASTDFYNSNSFAEKEETHKTGELYVWGDRSCRMKKKNISIL